ncbi:MAG: RidA family protein [Oscillospiraceae bacterium]|nr:RidA family protein [Oscillospiraceae bacterium]
MKQPISTPNAPAAIGPYSQGIAAGSTVYVSGQLPIDPATGTMPEGIQAQTAQALKNITNILAEQGMTLDNVVKTTVFLADLADFVPMNEVYGQFFSQPYPARSAVQVAKLPKDAPIEIECIAVK